jgi:hypothetical protein
MEQYEQQDAPLAGQQWASATHRCVTTFHLGESHATAHPVEHAERLAAEHWQMNNAAMLDW